MSPTREPRVLNRQHGRQPLGSFYVGRPGRYGNPFVIGRDGTRDEVCDKFDEWVMLPEQAELRERAKQELRGKDLVCWCEPERCHARTWIRIANA